MPSARQSLLIAIVVLCAMTAALLATGGLLAGVVGLGGGAAMILALSITAPEETPPAPITVAPPAPPPPLHLHPDLSALIDALGSPVLLIGDGRVLAANQSARDLLGGFIVGADVRSAIRHPAAVDRLTRRTGGGDDSPTDLVGLGTSGQRWTMQDMALPDGQQLVILTDQTARDAIERMRADFVANASHELRTPLAAILGYVETLQDAAAGGDPAVRGRFLGIIDTEARRMHALVLDLLSISRIESGKHIAPTTPVEIEGIVRTVAQQLADSTHREVTSIGISTSAPDLPPVIGDAGQLTQMIHNIIGNALRYGRDGAPVRIAIGPVTGGMLRLSIADQGDGIAPEHLPRLTERFYRVDSARSQALGGTGLGLAIVRNIVERHRGELDIDSVVGRGTTVSVRLPVSGSG